MNARAVKDLQYELYLKILAKLHEPSYDYSFIVTGKITKARELICTTVQIKM